MLQSVTEDDIPLLKALVPLNTLPAAELTALLETLEIRSSGEGSVLFQAGDTDTGNLYLLSGRIELLAGESVVDVIIAGAATARFPIAHRFPRKYSARARTAVRYVVVESHLLGRLLEKDRRDALRADDGDIGDDTADWIGKLLQSRVFQSLPKEALHAVLQRMRAIDVHAGDELIREGEPGDYFYLLDRGEALVSRDGEQLALLHGGDMFGEEALLGDVPRGASVAMRSDGRVLRLDRDSFRQLVKLPVLRRCGMEAVPELVASGCVLLDVRDPEVFAQEHPAGAINLPFDSLRYQAASLAHERRYVVCGDVPGHALVACYLLTERGFDVTAMDGDARALVIDDDRSAAPSQPSRQRPGDGDAEWIGDILRTCHPGLAADYRLQIDDLGARLEAANRRCEQFAAQRDELRDRLAALERQQRTWLADERFRESFDQRLKAQQAQSDALETELALMRRLEVEARNEARKQHRECTRLGEALQERDERLQSLMSERDQARQRAETLAPRGDGQDDVATEDEARRVLRRTQLDLEHRLGVVTDKLNEAEEQARKRQRQRDKDVATLSDKIAGLERQLRDSGRAFIDANNRYKEAEQAYQEQISLLEARLQRQEAGLDDEVVARRDRERLVLINQLDEQEARARELDQEVADLRRQLQASTEEATELREIIETYAGDREVACGQSGDVQVEALKAELALVREQAEAELESMASRLGLAREVGDDSQPGSVEQENLRQELSVVQRALREREEALEAAHDERQFLEDSLEDRDQDLDRISGRLSALEVALRDRELRMGELEAEIAQSKAALAKCHKERDAIQAADFRDARFAAVPPSGAGMAARPGSWLIGLFGGLVLAGAGAWLGWHFGWLPLPVAAGRSDVVAEPTTDASRHDEAVARPAPEAHHLPTRGGPLSPVAVRDRLADGSLGPAMRQLSGSLFLMGGDAAWAPRNARPRHSVSIGRFWIGEREVSVAEYQRFVRATGRRAPTDFGWRGDDLPVTGVSWEDASAYAVWLSRQTGKHYRLPSEGEWEYAAAGGSTARYWWGEKPLTGMENCADCGTRYDNRQPAPTGSFAANGFGLFDVAGNVMEWVEDCYRANYRVGLADADCRRHVFRGGSFHRLLAQLTTVARGQGSPDMRMPYLGFRVARDD